VTAHSLTPEEERAIRSLERNIREHEEKLDAYRSHPDAYDNQRHLKGASSDEYVKASLTGEYAICKEK
jgi:hypothetical protein